MDTLLITLYFNEKEKSACAFARVAALLGGRGKQFPCTCGKEDMMGRCGAGKRIARTGLMAAAPGVWLLCKEALPEDIGKGFQACPFEGTLAGGGRRPFVGARRTAKRVFPPSRNRHRGALSASASRPYAAVRRTAVCIPG